MKFQRSKSTKRFNFRVSRNTSSHQSGANSLIIESKGYNYGSGKQTGYSSGTTDPGTFTMTVKEAKALQGFLNKTLEPGISTGS